MSITKYYTKLKILWEEYLMMRTLPTCTCNPTCSCGAMYIPKEYFESECVVRFIKGLNDRYNPIKSEILLTQLLPLITNAFGMAIKHERQIFYASEHPDIAEINARQLE